MENIKPNGGHEGAGINHSWQGSDKGDSNLNHTWENRSRDSEHGKSFNTHDGHNGHSMSKNLNGGGEMGKKTKKMKKYKQMCEKALDRMSALFGQNVEPHEMTQALLLAVKSGSPEEIVSAIEIFSDYRWAVNEKKELAEELEEEDDDE